MATQLSSDFEVVYPPTEYLSPRKLKLKAISDRAERDRDLYIFLVHGFNVRGWAAEGGFERFRENTAAISWTSPKTCFPSRGPENWRIGRRYPSRRSLGVLLAEHLSALGRKRDKEVHLVLIGHSMGCRVILETIERIMQTPGALENKRIDIFLMAAAVPTRMVEEGERLHRAAMAPGIRMVFYSRIDEALLAFPIGQRIAATTDPEEGLYPVAVGWNGGPDGVWTERERKWYLHGHYWPSRSIVQSVAQKLHMEESRELSTRELGDRPLGAAGGDRLGDRRIG